MTACCQGSSYVPSGIESTLSAPGRLRCRLNCTLRYEMSTRALARPLEKIHAQAVTRPPRRVHLRSCGSPWCATACWRERRDDRVQADHLDLRAHRADRGASHVEIRPRVAGLRHRASTTARAPRLHAGAVLFTIDARPYQAALDRATAELARARARAELARLEAARAESSSPPARSRAPSATQRLARRRRPRPSVAGRRSDGRSSHGSTSSSRRSARRLPGATGPARASRWVTTSPAGPHRRCSRRSCRSTPCHVYFTGDEQTFPPVRRARRARAGLDRPRRRGGLPARGQDRLRRQPRRCRDRHDPHARRRAQSRQRSSPGLYARVRLAEGAPTHGAADRRQGDPDRPGSQVRLRRRRRDTVERRDVKLGRIVDGMRIVDRRPQGRRPRDRRTASRRSFPGAQGRRSRPGQRRSGSTPSANGAVNFSRFFVDRPIFAAVLSILIFAAGAIAIPLLPVSEYPEVVPPTGAGPRVLSGREPEGPRRDRRRAARAGDQRRRGHDVHEVGRVERRHDDARPSRSSPAPIPTRAGPGPEPRRAGAAAPARGRAPPRRGHAEAVVEHHARRAPAVARRSLRRGVPAQLRRAPRHRRAARASPASATRSAFGAGDYAMRVWLDPGKVAARGLTAGDVVRAIREQNVQVSAGQLGAPPTPNAADFLLSINAPGPARHRGGVRARS